MEHFHFHGDQNLLLIKKPFFSIHDSAAFRGRFRRTATIQQLPTATATVVNLPSAAGLWIVVACSVWRKASSHLLKGPGPLEWKALGKNFSQGIETVFAVRSRENLTGIIGWKFISLKQPLADFFAALRT